MIPNTFHLPATAREYLVAESAEQLRSWIADGCFRDVHTFVVGAGSNVVFTRPFDGVVLHVGNSGVRCLSASSTEVLVEAAAGVEWDAFVRHCSRQGWHGLENLVAIPGTVGAAPVQNVGAYGAEAKDFVAEVRTIDLRTGEERCFDNAACRFAYRDSVFKHLSLSAVSPHVDMPYVVVSVVFRLSPSFVPNMGYKALADHFAGCRPSPQEVLDFITDLRWSKLPHPDVLGSAGSFFKNPVVGADTYAALKQRFPDMVAFPVGEDFKLAAGWLIEHAGWKGRALGRCGVYDKQALVLVNLGGCSGSEVVALADAVAADVRRRFGVVLEKEAILL